MLVRKWTFNFCGYGTFIMALAGARSFASGTQILECNREKWKRFSRNNLTNFEIFRKQQIFYSTDHLPTGNRANRLHSTFTWLYASQLPTDFQYVIHCARRIGVQYPLRPTDYTTVPFSTTNKECKCLSIIADGPLKFAFEEIRCSIIEIMLFETSFYSDMLVRFQTVYMICIWAWKL